MVGVYLVWIEVLPQCPPPPHQLISRACIPQPQFLVVPVYLQISQLGFQPTSFLQALPSDLTFRVRVTFLSTWQDLWLSQQQECQDSTLCFTEPTIQDHPLPISCDPSLCFFSFCSVFPSSGFSHRLYVFSVPLPFWSVWLCLHNSGHRPLQVLFLGIKPLCQSHWRESPIP